ncbi:HpcH/HpaI aldolase family protein [Devosia epidermidihirudinis]|uniref:HpcH/HpaI aldolase family protein n=1 Tax=Devosia epidermidihirudinis TaxID=1293439 RepID=UPI00069718DE|nr:aldolase/citrate lyase family protein [Devosia epidermidihirudinis]
MTLKQRLLGGDMLYGAWSGFADPQVVQIMGGAGFDFICVDLQHSFNTMASLSPLLDGLHKVGSPAAVRVPWNTPDLIMRSLDLGAEVIIVPLVNNAEEATIAANACRYAPAGNRSWGPIWRNVRSSVPQPAEGDASATCIAMIETAEGLANVDAILAVDGVDGIYIGPNDLSLSIGLGRTSYLESDKLRETILHIIARGKAAGKLVGIDCGGSEQAHYWRDQGVSFVISANDSDLLAEAAIAMAKANRA